MKYDLISGFSGSVSPEVSDDIFFSKALNMFSVTSSNFDFSPQPREYLEVSFYIELLEFNFLPLKLIRKSGTETSYLMLSI